MQARVIQKLKALVWSSLSALLGVAGAAPSVPALSYPRLALFQAAASEDPGLGLIAGVIGLWHGLRARSQRAILLSAVGIMLGLRRWLRRERTSRALSDAMRAGLGTGWQRDLPPDLLRAFPQRHRADLIHPLCSLPLRGVLETRDVLFTAPDGSPQRLDVYQPTTPGPHPMVMVVHGGDWVSGDKGHYALGLHNRWLAAQGYVVCDIQYRLGARWPAPLADVKCAVRWIKLHAARYGGDPARLALLGRSAGAHLALMAAYTANDPGLTAGCFPQADLDERVQAVIACHAPTDLQGCRGDLAWATGRLLGARPNDDPDAYANASPLLHVKSGLPPTLLVAGARDRTVPPVHAEKLAIRLRDAGVSAVLSRVPGGRHGCDALLVGLSGPMVLYDIDRFLAWAFARTAADRP